MTTSSAALPQLGANDALSLLLLIVSIPAILAWALPLWRCENAIPLRRRDWEDFWRCLFPIVILCLLTKWWETNGGNNVRISLPALQIAGGSDFWTSLDNHRIWDVDKVFIDFPSTSRSSSKRNSSSTQSVTQSRSKHSTCERCRGVCKITFMYLFLSTNETSWPAELAFWLNEICRK